MARTIQSPGVEIKEIDLSLRPALPVGTNVLVTGFSQKGPTDEIIGLASLSEFEQIYGPPSNAMERYFYHTVKAVLDSPANLIVSRLPYGAGGGDIVGGYSALFFPVYAKGTTDAWDPNQALSTAKSYYFGEPTQIDLSDQQYLDLEQGHLVWSDKSDGAHTFVGNSAVGAGAVADWGKAGMIVVNTRKSVISQKLDGYYFGVVDNTNLNPATAYDGVMNLYSVNSAPDSSTMVYDLMKVPLDRLSFPLSSVAIGVGKRDGTPSEVLENVSPFDISTQEFSDVLTVGLFKVRPSVLDPDTTKLDYILTEAYTGSLNSFRISHSQDGGPAITYYLPDTSASSPNMRIFVNDHISKTSGDWFNTIDALPERKVRMVTSHASNQADTYVNNAEAAELSAFRTNVVEGLTDSKPADNLYPSGSFRRSDVVSTQAGAIPAKLERVFELVDNHELFPLDIVCEAGLGTIFAGTSGGLQKGWDDETVLDVSTLYTSKQDLTPPEYVLNYRAVNGAFITFAQHKRKDLLYVADGLRNIFVQGRSSKTLDQRDITSSDPTTKKNFSLHIYWPLRHLFGSTNSSYACAYANWLQIYDRTMNRGVWMPFSGFAAKLMALTDSNFYPWYAPAGFTRGLLTNALDIALYPRQKHRDQLYKINLNPISNFPNDGFVVFGQKTMQRKPSAFDRINVRRLFLYLEKAVRATVKYFVFEPNTLFTRTQVVNVLTPIFERAKNTEGMYDYLIVCDERNNPPDVIDQNEMVIDIYIKPVRSAEFILVNFYATRTGQDFSELVA
jgi:hypothetical protein